jgi:hypothetical protein
MKERQEAREAAFEPLAEILERRQELQQQLAALDEPYAKAFVEAEAAGWTAEELKDIGAEEPLKRPKAPRGRPRGRRTAAKKEAPETASSDTSTAAPAVTLPAQEGAAETAAATSGSVSG